MKKRKKWPIVLGSVITILVVLTAAFFIYAGQYYHADNEAIQALAGSNLIEVKQNDNELIFKPQSGESKKGFIFYPGGKVEDTAYAPLMKNLAKKGYTCIIVRMPFNLAVFDMNAADDVIKNHPEITSWYIGGHSLGGAMAASYAAEHSKQISGLALMGAYSTKDLSASSMKIVSVYGSKDGVLNKEKYIKNKANLPSSFKELCIEGGNHAGFGNYGQQKGDGQAAITAEKQQQITADTIAQAFE